MKCQLFPLFGLFLGLTFAPGLTSVHAAGETALDTATIEAITGLKAFRIKRKERLNGRNV